MSELDKLYEVERNRIKQLLVDAQGVLKEPQKYLGVISVAFTFFILSGGMYILLEGTDVIGGAIRISFFYYPWLNKNDQPIGNGHLWDTSMLIPDYHGQYLIESLLILLFLLLGSAGVFLVKYSTRYAYDVRFSTSLMILGWILVFIATGAMLILFGEKDFRFAQFRDFNLF